MDGLFRFPAASKNDEAVAQWFAANENPLTELAEKWFRSIESVGVNVRILLHDGYPTACFNDVAFAYVGVFKAHVNVGFFRGSELPDPDSILVGTGKRMRHVKLRPSHPAVDAALQRLIREAYDDIQRRSQ
ncbi:MAG: DUF1801 domain-containing protein [Pseudomonadota bacterium]